MGVLVVMDKLQVGYISFLEELGVTAPRWLHSAVRLKTTAGKMSCPEVSSSYRTMTPNLYLRTMKTA